MLTIGSIIDLVDCGGCTWEYKITDITTKYYILERVYEEDDDCYGEGLYFGHPYQEVTHIAIPKKQLDEESIINIFDK